MFLESDLLRPKVGDIVVFAPGHADPDAWEMTVSAAENGSNKSCVLSPNVMADKGGSLVVEARRESGPESYRLHWAGQRTSEGSQDCGSSADVTVTRVDLQKLANAAGGFGIRDKGVILR